jgi:hypothetical protein
VAPPDARRLGRIVLGIGVLALAFVVVVLFVAGVQKNAQITRLQRDGVPVSVTVSGCLGLLGGSGSNAAGYSCKGTFTLEGHIYRETIPGNTLRTPGTTLRAVTVPDDPALVDTAGAVAREHASWRVFILPAVLLVVLALGVIAGVLRRGRSRTT